MKQEFQQEIDPVTGLPLWELVDNIETQGNGAFAYKRQASQDAPQPMPREIEDRLHWVRAGKYVTP